MDTVPLINALLASDKFKFKVATKDWHPETHISFAANHPEPNNKPFESFIEMSNHVADKPNEKMHGPIKEIYRMRTNFRDVAKQVSCIFSA